MYSLHKWVWAWTNSEVRLHIVIHPANRVLQAIFLPAHCGRTNTQAKCVALKYLFDCLFSIPIGCWYAQVCWKVAFLFKIDIYFYHWWPVKTSGPNPRQQYNSSFYTALCKQACSPSATKLQQRHGTEEIGQREKREAGTNHCLNPIYLTMLRLPGSWRFSSPCVLHG